MAAAQLLVRIAYEWLAEHLSWDTFDKYATSSTATAVGAIGAATIAATAVGLTLAHNKNVEANKTWWETFEWAAERAVPSKKETEALPYRTSLDILSPLMDSDLRGFRFTKASKKSWTLRTQACGSIVELVNQRYAAEKSLVASTESDDSASKAADVHDFEAVKSFIEAHPNARASRVLAATHYEMLLAAQLNSLISENDAVKVLTSPEEMQSHMKSRSGGQLVMGMEPDVLVVRGGRAVALELKVLSRPSNSISRHLLSQISDYAKRLGDATGIPTLFLLNHPIPVELLNRVSSTPYLHVMHWDGNDPKLNGLFTKKVKHLLGV